LSHGEIATDAGERHGVLVDVRKHYRSQPAGAHGARTRCAWVFSHSCRPAKSGGERAAVRTLREIQ